MSLVDEEKFVAFDPEKVVFHDNKVVKAIQKSRYCAMCLVGTIALRHLQTRGLMVVERGMFFKLLEKADKEAFDAIYEPAKKTDHQENQQ